MVHRGIAEAHALLLVQVEVEAVDAAVLEQVGGPGAGFTVHHRMAVGAEPHRDALFGQDAAHAVLHEPVRHVEVLGRVATRHIAQVLDGDLLALGVLGARVVDQAHVILQAGVHVLVPELDRRDLAVAVELALLVGPLPVEALRRLAQVDRQDAVAGGHALSHDLVDLRGIGEHACHLGVQHRAQLGVHRTGVLGGLGLREQVLGHGAILLVDVHGHRPLAAVAHHVGEQMLHQTGVGGLAGLDQRGHVLEEVVDALELVEVHRVVLRELELLEAHVLLGNETGHVQGAEQPAAAGTILMGHRAVVHGHGESALQQTGAVIVAGHLVDARGGNGVHRQSVRGIGFEIGAQRAEGLGAQRREFSHIVPFFNPRLRTRQAGRSMISRHPLPGSVAPRSNSRYESILTGRKRWGVIPRRADPPSPCRHHPPECPRSAYRPRPHPRSVPRSARPASPRCRRPVRVHRRPKIPT